MKPHGERLADALADTNVRTGLLNFQRAWADARSTEIARLEQATGSTFSDLRHDLAERKRSARHNPALLDEFVSRAEAAGCTVTFAADAAEANAAIVRICREVGATTVVKTKSMLSEEIGMNAALASAEIAAVETDLGEWLLQIAGEHPSHLVLPAIHKRKEQIAELLERALGRPFDPDDIETMVRVVRTELRASFLEAAVGVTGANALIAETGSILLVTNEGNAGLTTALPATRIVLGGVEKLVATLDDALAQIRLLAKSATGQPITTYTQFLTGPYPGQSTHIVLVDNGRREMLNDPIIEDALSCIRCGACSNVCPPYQVVGGHGFGHVYTGAIGLVVTAFHHGIEAAEGPQSLCVSCGACTAACPAEIPLAEQILEIRRKVVAATGLPRSRRIAHRILRSRRLSRAGVTAAALVTAPLRRGTSLRLPPVGRHLSWRAAPAPALRPAHRRLAARADAPGDVALFIQCVTDMVLPGVAEATVRVVEGLGHQVTVPGRQHCCGLPAFDSGDHETARTMAKSTIEALEGDRAVVTPAPSCAAMIAHEYPRLFANDPLWSARAEQLAARTLDLVSWVDRHPERDRVLGAPPEPDGPTHTVHRFCQSASVLGLSDEMDRLIADSGMPCTPLAEQHVCCGFGGSTSFTHPEVSAGIVQRKLDKVAETGAAVLVTDNPGCLLHLRGAAARRTENADLEVRHIAEVLAGRLAEHEEHP